MGEAAVSSLPQAVVTILAQLSSHINLERGGQQFNFKTSFEDLSSKMDSSGTFNKNVEFRTSCSLEKRVSYHYTMERLVIASLGRTSGYLRRLTIGVLSSHLKCLFLQFWQPFLERLWKMRCRLLTLGAISKSTGI